MNCHQAEAEVKVKVEAEEGTLTVGIISRNEIYHHPSSVIGHPLPK
jgi:hypothetical protein